MMMAKTWNNHDIRFEERDGECWFDLGDICDALDVEIDIVVAELLDLDRSTLSDDNMVSEAGVYHIMSFSDIDTMRKYRIWSANVMKKLRSAAGLEGYDALRLSEPEIQECIDDILDTLYYDDTTGKVMRSITVQGGDVEQIEFA